MSHLDFQDNMTVTMREEEAKKSEGRKSSTCLYIELLWWLIILTHFSCCPRKIVLSGSDMPSAHGLVYLCSRIFNQYHSDIALWMLDHCPRIFDLCLRIFDLCSKIFDLCSTIFIFVQKYLINISTILPSE